MRVFNIAKCMLRYCQSIKYVGGDDMIRLENIDKFYYTDAGVTQALRRVSLEFHVGEFVAITGESGSGKSSLLNVISGMDTFDEGEMFVQGQPTFHYDESDWEKYRRDTIGFVFQNYNLIGHYSALDNVVAALLIQGMEIEQARSEAADYLEQVGLGEFMNQRASSLSSGQKQRLSIARALAKKTSVLVADEPTGNLDSNTGRAIVELLASLSKDRLVIMVTHNYDQARPFITRKVRLHGGEVVADIVVKDGVEGGAYRAPLKPEPSARREQRAQKENALSKNILQDDGQSEAAGDAKAPGTGTAGKKTSKSSRKNAKSDKKKSHFLKNSLNFFALHNIRSQPNRAGMFFSSFAMTALVSFLFLGELFIQSDDIRTKVYDSSAYLQENDCRLSVRHKDGSVITDKDLGRIRSVKYVKSVDAYDEVSDIRYYIDKNHDYKEVYSDQEEKEQTNEDDQSHEMKTMSHVEFLDDTHFMRSATAITKDDLKAGRLPKTRGEIVMYSNNTKTLNKKLACYFTADNIWTKGQYYEKDLKVVGLLKKNTDQVYFQSEFCRMLLAGARGVFVDTDYRYNLKTGMYDYNAYTIPVIGDDLEILVNTARYLPIQDKFDDEMQYQLRYSRNYATTQTGRLNIHTNPSQQRANELTFIGRARMKITGYVNGKMIKKQLRADLQEDLTTKDSGYFVEIPEKLFWEMYDWDTDQAAVYINHYSKTKRVIAALDKLGYTAINSAQVSATQYDPAKVTQRLILVALSVLVLIFLAVVQVLILRSMLKAKLDEFYVLKFMGMREHQLSRIVYRELMVYCVTAVIAVLIVTFAFSLPGSGLLFDSYQYMELPGILLFVGYNLILMWMTAAAFCRQVKKNTLS